MLTLGLAGLGAGCGFRPLYGPERSTEGELGADLRTELASVRVRTIPDRVGQLLRRDLERRLEGGAPGTPARYALAVEVSFGIDPIGYRRDGVVTRIRSTATGRWTLSTLAVPPVQVAGSVMPLRTLDSFNIPDLQFFAADSARDAMERRTAEVLAEDIARQLALALRPRLRQG